MSKSLCLIIGFSYSRLCTNEMLHSSIIDMYLVYHFFRMRKFECEVITDIMEHNGDIISSRIIEDKVDDEVLKFVGGKLKDVNWNVVESLDDVLTAISTINMSEVTRLCVYYTGHCDLNRNITNIVIPNGDRIPIVKLRDIILSDVSTKAQIIEIYDSCHLGSTSLTYKYEGDFTLLDMDNPLSHDIMHISSTELNELGLSSLNRSLFTKYLISVLSSKCTIRLDVILKEVQKKLNKRVTSNKCSNTTIGIYTSFLPPQPLLWSWMLPSATSFNLIVDSILIN